MSTRYEREGHKCETSATSVRQNCYTNDTSATRVKNFDSDNDTRENIYSHQYTTLWQMEDYREKKNFIPRPSFWKCLVPMPKCV